MPQIWLTYDELGATFGIAPDQARSGAIEAGWPRRRCSDGLARVKLPPAAAHEFMLAYARGALAPAPEERTDRAMTGRQTLLAQASPQPELPVAHAADRSRRAA